MLRRPDRLWRGPQRGHRTGCVRTPRGGPRQPRQGFRGPRRPGVVQSRARARAIWTQQETDAGRTPTISAIFPREPLPFDGFQMVHGSPLDEDEYSGRGRRRASLRVPGDAADILRTHAPAGRLYLEPCPRGDQSAKTPAARSARPWNWDSECGLHDQSWFGGAARDGDPRADTCCTTRKRVS